MPFSVFEESVLSVFREFLGMLERQLQSSQNTTKLFHQLLHLWQNLPAKYISNLQDSMRHLVSAFIVAEYDFTNY